MEMQQIIEHAEQNIRQALADYWKHSDTNSEIYDEVTEVFIKRLAKDSSYAKQDLRELFSKSPVWDERIDALVINGTRTHDPDYERIRDLEMAIFHPLYIHGPYDTTFDTHKKKQIREAMEFFASPDSATCTKEVGLQAIKELAPKAYAPTKKLSRVFKALCVALGVADETAGSNFQRLYAQFADELNAKKISFKLYVSINPAHFLTMSNPKGDNRGCTLTSCHSFNQMDYEYNVGCVGYTRDDVSFIVFTVDDPGNPESLNNRKTTRQIFAYRPGNGLLLQSRMYNTSGGTHGAQADSKLYRDLVQREISMLEGAVNLWKTYSYCDGEYECCVDRAPDFGGYPDWEYPDFDGKVSIRTDHADGFETLRIGAAGLCVCCGNEISHGLYCGDWEHGTCESNSYRCDDCEDSVSETFRVYDNCGEELWVCEDCRNSNYTRCQECGEYYSGDQMEYVGGGYVCRGCYEDHYFHCSICEEIHHEDDEITVRNASGYEESICRHCCGEYFTECDECGEYRPDNMTHIVRTEDGEINICDDCLNKYPECPECGEHIEIADDGTCPACGAVIREKEETA